MLLATLLQNLKVSLKIALLFSLIFLLFGAKNSKADVITQEKVFVQPNVIVSATIGTPKMTLWGHGPTGSIIELSGVGVEQKIISREDGYYSFDLVYIPDTQYFPELCVTAIDKEGRATPPTCIPEISAGNYFYNVGPVVLPPTISLDASQANPGSQASAQGQTIPLSNVQVVLSRPEFAKNTLGFSIVKTALAYYLPSYSVTSDSDGEFSFNMPANDGTTWRVFTIVEYTDLGRSPKSNTLKFENLTSAAYFWKTLWQFLATFLTWPRIIFLEILIIIILTMIFLMIVHRKNKSTKTSLPEEILHKESNIVKVYQDFLNKKKFN